MKQITLSLGNTNGTNPRLLIPKTDTAPLDSPIAKEQLVTMVKNGEDVTQVDSSLITDMSSLFSGSTSFNQDISGWNVNNMESMFFKARGFSNQDLSDWNVLNVNEYDNFSMRQEQIILNQIGLSSSRLY